MIDTTKLSEFTYIFFRSRMFNRIILIFSIITIVTFCTLAVLVYKFSMNSMVQKEISAQRQAVDGISRYLDQQMDQSQDIVLQFYQNQQLLSDMLYFLRHDFPLYIQFRFNNFIASNSTEDNNMESFIKRHLEHNADILQIAVYSKSQSVLFMFNSNKTQYLRTLNDEKQQLDTALETMRFQKINRSQALGLDKILDLPGKGSYTTAFDLNDPDTLTTEGALLITFKPDSLSRALALNGEKPMGSNLVLFPDGYTLYDSLHRYNGQLYPYARQLTVSTGVAELEAKSYTTSTRSPKSDLLVSGIVPFKELSDRYAEFRGRLLILTSIGIFITIMFSYLAMYRYAKRTQVIVRAMKQAQQGNLSFRVPANKSDELDEISVSFNKMCEELMSYIDQVYVSEIKQKQAELIAFQAQINPHFLYNTLEAIRMSALTNGASDAGEMLYLLGALFRYAVKPETLVTLEEETVYCKQYLELYRVRYKDKINYLIDIEDSYNKVPVFKLLLQPLIENAIVHGIRPSKQGNLVVIRAFRGDDGESLMIEVEDNGKGMEPKQLHAIQEMLAARGAASRQTSLGIRNVHERIRLTYGEGYGLEIRSRLQEGTCIRVRLPYEGGEQLA